MNKYKNHNTDNPIYSLLTPDNRALIMIDFQPQMAFATKSIDGQILINNAVGLIKSAKIFSAGAVPITWLSFLLELQRDWTRLETYQAVTSLAMEDAGTYGMGIEYAKAMLGENYTEAAIAAEELRKDGRNLNVK